MLQVYWASIEDGFFQKAEPNEGPLIECSHDEMLELMRDGTIFVYLAPELEAVCAETRRRDAEQAGAAALAALAAARHSAQDAPGQDAGANDSISRVVPQDITSPQPTEPSRAEQDPAAETADAATSKATQRENAELDQSALVASSAREVPSLPRGGTEPTPSAVAAQTPPDEHSNASTDSATPGPSIQVAPSHTKCSVVSATHSEVPLREDDASSEATNAACPDEAPPAAFKASNHAAHLDGGVLDIAGIAELFGNIGNAHVRTPRRSGYARAGFE